MPQHRYVIPSESIPADQTLRADRGWVDMEVRWLVTAESVGAEQTVVGRTVLRPGSQHDIHRHPNAEEWEYVVSGSGIKHVGDESLPLEAGDVVFVPRNVYHGLENASGTEPLVTIWGYSGGATLEQAGYFLPEDD
jgi:quercetin dioxygenase-like cupin family protein